MKRDYEKPLLRKVRLEIKTSVLTVCNTSIVSTPYQAGDPPLTCKVTTCLTSN